MKNSPPEKKQKKPLEVIYKASLTLASFHKSNALVRAIMGPMGSGKSTACCAELIRRAWQQKAGPDGLRRSRWLVVRNTYPELRDTTIRTFQSWFGPEIFPGAYTTTPPPRQVIRDGDVEAEFIFTALDRPEDVRKLLSLDITGAWLNEARELAEDVLTYLVGRIGRYPAQKDGGASWRGVMLDTNPPHSGHWFYKLFEEKKPAGYELYKQPSGLCKHAENIENLPKGYYTQLAGSMDENTARVMVHGEYGMVKHGQPVFGDVFKESLHVAAQTLHPLDITAGKPVVIGMDFGLTPAAVFLQQTPLGQWRVLHEVVPERLMGAEQFAPILKKMMQNKELFHHRQTFEIYGDPAGAQRAQTDARTAYDVFRAHGLLVRPSPTQSVADRLTVVRQTLAREIRAASLNNNLQTQASQTQAIQIQRGFILSPTCTTLRQGFNGGYRYRTVQIDGRPTPENTPDKNHYSHIMDALQYALAGGGEFHLMRKKIHHRG